MKPQKRRDVGWRSELAVTTKGEAKLSLRNVVTVLREAPEWARAFAFDLLSTPLSLR